ncbi:6790_t:CDS:2 [Funneliformis mosseae]|uniref:6790_t:CDS:1 n=1 Tax=Funneliformis mosseae TaxID=27381 RepID=A0A9N9HVW6_FUNMO|nr:6790_t:CDS:2 [Funneliformis mosseae]
MVSQEYLEKDNNDINTWSFPNTSLGDVDDESTDLYRETVTGKFHKLPKPGVPDVPSGVTTFHRHP